MVDSGFGTRQFWLPKRGDTRHMYFTSHQRLCRLELCASWAKSGKGNKDSDY